MRQASLHCRRDSGLGHWKEAKHFAGGRNAASSGSRDNPCPSESCRVNSGNAHSSTEAACEGTDHGASHKNHIRARQDSQQSGDTEGSSDAREANLPASQSPASRAGQVNEDRASTSLSARGREGAAATCSPETRPTTSNSTTPGTGDDPRATAVASAISAWDTRRRSQFRE